MGLGDQHCGLCSSRASGMARAQLHAQQKEQCHQVPAGGTLQRQCWAGRLRTKCRVRVQPKRHPPRPACLLTRQGRQGGQQALHFRPAQPQHALQLVRLDCGGSLLRVQRGGRHEGWENGGAMPPAPCGHRYPIAAARGCLHWAPAQRSKGSPHMHGRAGSAPAGQKSVVHGQGTWESQDRGVGGGTGPTIPPAAPRRCAGRPGRRRARRTRASAGWRRRGAAWWSWGVGLAVIGGGE